MLDLAKPLGIHEGLIFYGDHELDEIVYYFPDEVSLAPQSGAGSTGGGTPFYELFFQLFSEGDVVEGGIEALRKTAGSILSLGIQCTVAPARLDKAVQKLKGSGSFPDDLVSSTPLWSDGTVNLLVLDAINNRAETMSEEAFVKSIVGANKPSLMSSDLKSVFNVRLDRKGTALTLAALEGDTGNMAGVLYDLKFAAIRPALDLRIWADLGRCYESVSHQLSIKAEATYYVKFSLGAELSWITRKLEEEGHMKIEVLSGAEDAETKKMMDEMIKDFKESILREMFRPYVNPQTPAIPIGGIEGAMQSAVPVVGVAYKFTSEKITQNKIIDVDYRERSAITRTHNPQSHLWVMGKQIAANRDKYIQRVVFSDVWREQALTIQLNYDFDAADADLLSAEVIVWRSKHGVAASVPEGRFSLPEGISPIKNLSFHKGSREKKDLAWLYDRTEPVGYYYQIRFTYNTTVANISSPGEIITPPVFSTGEDLILFPDTYVFFKRIEVREGNIDLALIKAVDVSLKLKDGNGAVLDVETITINAANKQEFWTVRGKDKKNLYIEATKEFHYADERPSLKTAPQYLPEDELIINKPFQRSGLGLIPVVGGKSEAVAEILLEIIVATPELAEPVKTVYRIAGPAFAINEIKIPLNSDKDKITYTAKAIMQDARIVDISSGDITSNALVIDLNRLNNNEVVFIWQGRSPEALALKSLVLELHKIGASATETESLEFKGDKVPGPVTKTFPADAPMEWRIYKRFQNGSKERSDYQTVAGPRIIIAAE